MTPIDRDDAMDDGAPVHPDIALITDYLAREATQEEYKANPEFAKTMGMDAHIPPNVSLYGNPPLNDIHQWGMVVDWPVVAIWAALLPDGKVLAYDSIGDRGTRNYVRQDHTRATVWDPATGSQTEVWLRDGFNIFCSGLAHLMDGSVFIAGGNKDQQLNGIVQTHLFNPVTNTWSLGPNMAAGRWYPSVTPLNRPTPPAATTASAARAGTNSASLARDVPPGAKAWNRI